MLPLNFCTFEAERDTIDRVFGAALIGIGMALTLWLVQWGAGWWQARRAPPVDVGFQFQQPGVFRGRLLPLVFLAPTLIILALFLYYPSLDTFRLSTLLVRLGARRTAFVCVDNFTSLVADPGYYSSLLTTIGISLAIVVLGLALALLIALAAYQPVAGARIYRTLLIWPYAISPAVAGVIFLLLFNPAGGIINHLLNGIGIPNIPWLNNPTFAPWAVIIASVWKSMGFNILFYIAGLQNVPKDLQESAAIDGANAVQRFRHIVFPLLSPITFFLIITNMTYAFFETFGTIDYLTRGGPLESTTTLMYRIYQVGIQNNDLGKAAAQSIVLFIMVIGLTILQFRSTGRRVTYGA
ncbi:MAG: sugar ABC transporter permease [Chloroflexi bacterium]|nr:sugar ABC transporter permease [Chloroflexota bacterium]